MGEHGSGVVLRVGVRVSHALQQALPFDQPTYGQTFHCPTSPQGNLSPSSRCRAVKGGRPSGRPPQNMVHIWSTQSHPLLQVCYSARSRTAPTGTAVVLVKQVAGWRGVWSGRGDPVHTDRPTDRPGPRPTDLGDPVQPTDRPTDRPCPRPTDRPGVTLSGRPRGNSCQT